MARNGRTATTISSYLLLGSTSISLPSRCNPETMCHSCPLYGSAYITMGRPKSNASSSISHPPKSDRAITPSWHRWPPKQLARLLFDELKLPVQSDAQKVYQTVADEYKKQFNLIWLDQAAMNDTQISIVEDAGVTPG